MDQHSTPPTVNPRVNELLANLPSHEYEKLTAHMELVSLPKGQDLFLDGQIPEHIHYPVGAIVSMMRDMPDGFSVETYMLGRSNAVGLSGLNGFNYFRANVRHSGLAYRMPLPTLRRLMPQCPVHAATITSTLVRMIMQLTQAVVCGKHHSVEQQLIRWMLVTLDRVLEPVIQSTHQEISERLGFRREAITLALGKLTALGYISPRRGAIEVTQREGLEALVCDCYWMGQQKIKPDFGKTKMTSEALCFDE